MQVGSKVSLLPKSNGARGSLPFRAAGVLAPHNRKERTYDWCDLPAGRLRPARRVDGSEPRRVAGAARLSHANTTAGSATTVTRPVVRATASPVENRARRRHRSFSGLRWKS